jgi:hypothetical protein
MIFPILLFAGEAAALEQLESKKMICEELKATLRSEGKALVRYPSSRVAGMIRYDMFVAESPSARCSSSWQEPPCQRPIPSLAWSSDARSMAKGRARTTRLRLVSKLGRPVTAWFDASALIVCPRRLSAEPRLRSHGDAALQLHIHSILDGEDPRPPQIVESRMRFGISVAPARGRVNFA